MAAIVSSWLGPWSLACPCGPRGAAGWRDTTPALAEGTRRPLPRSSAGREISDYCRLPSSQGRFHPWLCCLSSRVCPSSACDPGVRGSVPAVWGETEGVQPVGPGCVEPATELQPFSWLLSQPDHLCCWISCSATCYPMPASSVTSARAMSLSPCPKASHQNPPLRHRGPQQCWGHCAGGTVGVCCRARGQEFCLFPSWHGSCEGMPIKRGILLA